MRWFESLMGFPEVSPHQVRNNILINGDKMTSLVNDKTFTYSAFQMNKPQCANQPKTSSSVI